MRIGIVCPYSFDVPGGVQNHVMDLAEALIALGHEVSVLAPADEDSPLPEYVVSAGRAVPLPYNGSVARIAFGPVSTARVRRWITNGDFDVLHVHEPLTLSLSLLAVLSARGPVVATFHTAMTRSRVLAAAQGVLQIVLERITARIAVSALARKVQVEHMDGGAVEIPNGVAVAKFADAEPLPGWPGSARSAPAARSASWAGSPRRARASRCCATLSWRWPPPGLVCGCSSPARVTPTTCSTSSPSNCTSRSRSSAWSAKRTRRACCAVCTSTSRRTPAVSRSA